MVAVLIREAIRTYTPDFSWIDNPEVPPDVMNPFYQQTRELWEGNNRWQFELIADSGIFRPVCYQTGKCMFQASADRGCTIRERVEAFAKHGVPSERWHIPHTVMNATIQEGPKGGEHNIDGINPREWALNPAAARS